MKKIFFCFFVLFLLQGCTENSNYENSKDKNKSFIIFKPDSEYISKLGYAATNYNIASISSCSFTIAYDNISDKIIPLSEIDTVFKNYHETDLFSIIFNRTSVRLFKEGKDIPESEIELILRAAMSIPTGWDKRALSFIIVRDKQIIKKLFQPTLIDENRNKNEFIGAKIVFVICGNPKISPAYNLDATLASLNIMYAAEYLNYGSCWSDIVPIQKRIDLTRKILKIPKTIIPYNMIAVGYREQKKHPRNKFDKNKVHIEFWNNTQKSNIGKNKFLNLE